MLDKKVSRLFYKRLAANDNSKNQIYLGGELSVVNVLPSGDLIAQVSSSSKPGAAGKQRLKASLPLRWLNADGSFHVAPKSQLILYPQYPEVRMSGFLAGSAAQLGEWFDPNKKGRQLGRTLVFGVASDGNIYTYLALPGSLITREIENVKSVAIFGALREIALTDTSGVAELLEELCRIHRLGWIASKRLDAKHNVLPCVSPQCGGYTLEAELGITPNGYSDPDYLGWEVKSFSVTDFLRIDSKVITLMTPEPDGGYYKDSGVKNFIKKFGYPDVGGQVDRLNFGGTHFFGKRHHRTALELALTGYDPSSGKLIDVNGGIALIASNGDCAALWTYAKLIDHWKKKHDKAVYVPAKSEHQPKRRYMYGADVLLGRGSDFESFLKAVAAGAIYYDPGIKMEDASGKQAVKRRNQFRVKARNLESLYSTFEKVPVCASR